jgi:hypothetical protein
MGRPRRHRPYDPAKVHDRRTTDLLRNAQVAAIEVDDPLEVGGKLMVMRSIRNDPLAGLHARKHIDEAQYQGGRAFQYDFETAERGPRAIDPSKEAVDGGLMPEPITDQQKQAVVRLNRAERALGQNGAAIAHGVLIHGMTIEQIGVIRGAVSELELKYLGRRFRECLDCLALVYGFAMEPQRGRGT